jgi:putative membrane protein
VGMRGASNAAVEAATLLAGTLAVLAWSGIAPYERGTWWMEVFPVLVGLPILVATYRRAPLSRLLYRLLFVHAVILMVGGHYTYARVPAGFWVQELWGLARNPYDRLGHLAQGFVPALLAREVLLRASPLGRGRWLPFLVVCVCLAVSACYELIEWWAALLWGAAAESFLGTQGDVWDTQWDMFMALVGAIAALTLLSRVHDRSLSRLSAPAPASGEAV